MRHVRMTGRAAQQLPKQRPRSHHDQQSKAATCGHPAAQSMRPVVRKHGAPALSWAFAGLLPLPPAPAGTAVTLNVPSSCSVPRLYGSQARKRTVCCDTSESRPMMRSEREGHTATPSLTYTTSVPPGSDSSEKASDSSEPLAEPASSWSSSSMPSSPAAAVYSSAALSADACGPARPSEPPAGRSLRVCTCGRMRTRVGCACCCAGSAGCRSRMDGLTWPAGKHSTWATCPAQLCARQPDAGPCARRGLRAGRRTTLGPDAQRKHAARVGLAETFHLRAPSSRTPFPPPLPHCARREHGTPVSPPVSASAHLPGGGKPRPSGGARRRGRRAARCVAEGAHRLALMHAQDGAGALPDGSGSELTCQ